MLAAVLVAALVAAAEPPTGAPLQPASPAETHAQTIPPEVVTEEKEEPRLKLLGLQVSIGAPEGLGVGAFVRPLPWLRVDGGAAWNYLSFGLQGGVTVMPWAGSVTPTLRFGIGQFFESDVRDDLGSFPEAFDPAFRKFGYHFYSAQLGLELGNENGAQFFVRGGLAWIRSDLESTTFTEGDTTITANDNDLSATTPSVQLGLLLHLW